MGFAAGAEALLQHLLPKLPSSLVLGGQEHPLGNCDVKIQEVELRLDDSPHSFGVCGWLALNTKNYASWKHHTDDQLRLNLLDQALTGHLRSMAERLGMPDFKQITGRVQRVDNQKRIRWHGAELVRFDVLAETNLHFPWGIGLGRVAAFGFGESLAVNDYVARRLYILNRAGVGAVVE